MMKCPYKVYWKHSQIQDLPNFFQLFGSILSTIYIYTYEHSQFQGKEFPLVLGISFLNFIQDNHNMKMLAQNKKNIPFLKYSWITLAHLKIYEQNISNFFLNHCTYTTLHVNSIFSRRILCFKLPSTSTDHIVLKFFKFNQFFLQKCV